MSDSILNNNKLVAAAAENVAAVAFDTPNEAEQVTLGKAERDSTHAGAHPDVKDPDAGTGPQLATAVSEAVKPKLKSEPLDSSAGTLTRKQKRAAKFAKDGNDNSPLAKPTGAGSAAPKGDHKPPADDAGVTKKTVSTHTVTEKAPVLVRPGRSSAGKLPIFSIPTEYKTQFPKAFAEAERLTDGYLEIETVDDMRALNRHLKEGVSRNIARQLLTNFEFVDKVVGMPNCHKIIIAPCSNMMTHGPNGHYIIPDDERNAHVASIAEAVCSNNRRKTFCRCFITDSGLCSCALGTIKDKSRTIVMENDVSYYIKPLVIMLMATQVAKVLVSRKVQHDPSARLEWTSDGMIAVGESIPGSGVYGDDSARQYAHLWMVYDGGDYRANVAGTSRVFHVDQRPYCAEMNRCFVIITCGKYPGMAESAYPPKKLEIGKFEFLMGFGYVAIDTSNGQLTVGRAEFDKACSVLRDSNLNAIDDISFRTDFRKNCSFTLDFIDDNALELLYNACIAYRISTRYAASESMYGTFGVHSASDAVVGVVQQSAWGVSWANLKRMAWRPFQVLGGGLPWIFTLIVCGMVGAALYAIGYIWYVRTYCPEFEWYELTAVLGQWWFPDHIQVVFPDWRKRMLRYILGQPQDCKPQWPQSWPFACLQLFPRRARGFVVFVMLMLLIEELVVQGLLMAFLSRHEAVAVWCFIEVIMNLVSLSLRLAMLAKDAAVSGTSLAVMTPSEFTASVRNALFQPFMAHIAVELLSLLFAKLSIPIGTARVVGHIVWNMSLLFAPYYDVAGWMAMLRLDGFYVVQENGGTIQDRVPELVRSCAARVEGICADAQSNMDPVAIEYPSLFEMTPMKTFLTVNNVAVELAKSKGLDFIDKSYYAVTVRVRHCAHPTRSRSWLMYCVRLAPVPLRMQSCTHNLVQAFMRRYVAAIVPPPSPVDIAEVMATAAYQTLIASANRARLQGTPPDSDSSVAAYQEKLRREGKLDLAAARREGRRASRTRTASNKVNESVLYGNVKLGKARMIVADGDIACNAINQVMYAGTKLLQEYDDTLEKRRDEATFIRFTGNSHELADKWMLRRVLAETALNTYGFWPTGGWFVLNFDIEACDGSWSHCVLAMSILIFVYLGIVPLVAVERLWTAGVLQYIAFQSLNGLEIDQDRIRMPWRSFAIPPTHDMYSLQVDADWMADLVVKGFTGKARDRRRNVEMYLSSKMGSGTAGTSVYTTIMACMMLKSAVAAYIAERGARSVDHVVESVESTTPILGNGDDTNHVVVASETPSTDLETERLLLEETVIRQAKKMGFRLTGQVELVKDLRLLTGDMCSKLAIPAVVNGIESIIMSRKIGRAIVMLGAADATIGERKVVEHFYGRILDVERDHKHDPITLSLAKGLLQSDCFTALQVLHPRGSASHEAMIAASRSDDHCYSAHVDAGKEIGISSAYYDFVRARYGISRKECDDLCEYLEQKARAGTVLSHEVLFQITTVDC